MTGNLKRRRADYDKGQDWPDAVRNDGIASRIAFAAPGTEIRFREATRATKATRDLVYDEIRQLTFVNVAVALTRSGVWDQGVKKVVGFGPENINVSPASGLGNIMDKDYKDMLDGCDVVGDEAERHVFVNCVLGRQIRESNIIHGSFDFSEFSDELVDIVMKMVESNDFGQLSVRPETFIGFLFDSFKLFLESKGAIFNEEGIKYRGELKRMDWAKMLRSWADKVVRGLGNHPKTFLSSH